MRGQQLEVLANERKVVLIFSRLELPPGISDLGAFESPGFEKRFRLFDLFAILSGEDVVMKRLGRERSGADDD